MRRAPSSSQARSVKSSARKKSRRRATSPTALGTWAELLDDIALEAKAGTICAINRAGRVLLGYGRHAPVGQPVASLIAPPVPPRLLAGKLDSLATGRQPKPITLLMRGGEALPVDLRVMRVGKAAEAHFILVARRTVDGENRTAEIQALSRQQQRVLEAASDGIIAASLDGMIESANRAAADMLNRDISGLVGLALDRAFVHGSGALTGMAGRPAPLRAQLWTGPHHVPLETRLARSDGESFDAEYTIAPITEGRQTQGYVISFRDITERKRAEGEMRLAAAVFEHAREGLLIADARGRVTKTNPAYCRITGYEPREIVGRALSDVLLADAKTASGATDPMRTLTQSEWEQWCKNKAGKRYAARITMSVVRDADERVQQYAALISDITQRKVDEEKILYQANYDQLTGLANRTLFMDRLTRLVVESKRARTNVGLMFIDLDGFKAINDTLGHDAGDLLLKGCARRLEKCVRESDTVARLGGDEFTVIMPLIDSLDAAAVVAGRIIRSLTEPFDLDGQSGNVSASIGISVLPTQASDASGLLRNADLAMYHAKRQGKANYQFYGSHLEGGTPDAEE